MDAQYSTSGQPDVSRTRPLRRRRTDGPLVRSSGGSAFLDPEAAWGGADALPDTPDVPEHGTLTREDWAPGARRGARRRRMVRWGEHLLLMLLAVFALLYVVEY